MLQVVGDAVQPLVKHRSQLVGRVALHLGQQGDDLVDQLAHPPVGGEQPGEEAELAADLLELAHEVVAVVDDRAAYVGQGDVEQRLVHLSLGHVCEQPARESGVGPAVEVATGQLQGAARHVLSA